MWHLPGADGSTAAGASSRASSAISSTRHYCTQRGRPAAEPLGVRQRAALVRSQEGTRHKNGPGGSRLRTTQRFLVSPCVWVLKKLPPDGRARRCAQRGPRAHYAQHKACMRGSEPQSPPYPPKTKGAARRCKKKQKKPKKMAPPLTELIPLELWRIGDVCYILI